jgi:D-galactarolactone cycloisomerase
VSKANKFRNELVPNPGAVGKDGNVWPLEKLGLGLDVNEEFLVQHPAIEGHGYI